MLGRTDRRLRLVALIGVFAVAAGAISVRLAYWQVLQRDRLVTLAHEQFDRELTDVSQRGTIYDRSGTVVLATTIYRDRLWATPSQIAPRERGEIGRELVSILGLADGPAQRVQQAVESDQQYVVLALDLTPSQSTAVRRGIEARRLVGVGLDPVPIRSFPTAGGAPDTTLASGLLGFVNREGKGQYGIEQRYQATLAGTPRRVIAQYDSAGRPIAATQRVVDRGVPGSDLILTIDARLQLQFEQELYAAWSADAAKSVSAVAIDPYTGEILAWATVPGYDANAFQAVANEDPSRFIDPIVGAVFEPGSVFKMLTTQAALENGTATLDTIVNDSGSLTVQGGRVYDADHIAKGDMKLADIIAWSRNVGAARIAMALGPDATSAASVLYRTWTKMGFGQPTGVDVAGEVPGLVRDPSVQPWRQIDLANASFGQGVAVTEIQLVRAFAAMANGGFLVRPHVVRAIGEEHLVPEPGTTVLSGDLSQELTGLMRHVVTAVPLYAQGTLIDGYLVGGKTGTAQIWDSSLDAGRGAYMDNSYNFSFVGYVGRDRPEVVIAVNIHQATPSVRGQGYLVQPVYSFGLFRRLAVNAMQTLDLAPPPVTAGGIATPNP